MCWPATPTACGRAGRRCSAARARAAALIGQAAADALVTTTPAALLWLSSSSPPHAAAGAPFWRALVEVAVASCAAAGRPGAVIACKDR
ncbi:MAG: hypothetical protein U0Z44_00275 [Kouleothrix sp.]